MSEIDWDGVGIPPIGAVCEGSMPSWGVYRKDWKQCRVIAHEQGSVVVIRDGSLLAWCDTFRPIRTKEQIEAEERDRAIKEMQKACNGLGAGAAIILYDAGYRKQGEQK